MKCETAGALAPAVSVSPLEQAYLSLALLPRAACAAARRAMGTMLERYNSSGGVLL